MLVTFTLSSTVDRYEIVTLKGRGGESRYYMSHQGGRLSMKYTTRPSTSEQWRIVYYKDKRVAIEGQGSYAGHYIQNYYNSARLSRGL